MTNMNKRTQTLLSTIAAAAVAAILTSSAMAQYRVGSDGRANDANNRVGSGGVNGGGSGGPVINGGNSYVTGNVTGGRQFRGFVPYTDPMAFRGNIGGQNVDNFTRTSAGVPIGVYDNNNAGNVTAYYGDSRGTNPPPQFQQQAPGQVGYVPAPIASRTGGDLRLGNPFADPVTSADQMRPGQLVLSGPVDQNSNQPTVITASPLYGVRQWRPGSTGDDQFLSSYTDIYATGRRGNAQLDAGSIARMRNELSADQARPDASLQNQLQNNPNNPNGTNGATNGNTPNGANGNQPATPDLNQPLNRPLGDTTGMPGANGANGTGANTGANQPLDSSVSTDPLNNSLATNQTRHTRMLSDKPLPPITANNPAWKALQERYDAMIPGREQIAEAEANRELNRQVLAQRNAKDGTAAGGQPGTPGAPGTATAGGASSPNGTPGMSAGTGSLPNTGTSGTTGGMTSGTSGTASGTTSGTSGTASGTNTPGGANNANTTSGIKTPEAIPGVTSATPRSGDLNKPRPVQINSLAKDMKASQAAELMKQAEELMRNGKYTSALDKYDTVDQVSPNDPLVALGKATAELGASYYSRAEGHLREAFTKNPQLLGGQYDLRVFLGNDRLQFLVSDLKSIDKGDAKQTRAVFLLAYIAYNTGNERNAAGYLDLADKRSGGGDPFYKLVRQHWALPEAAAPEEMNK